MAMLFCMTLSATRNCGTDHEQLRADDGRWSALPAARGGSEMHDHDIGIHLSTRNCAECGSTLSRPLPGHVL